MAQYQQERQEKKSKRVKMRSTKVLTDFSQMLAVLHHRLCTIAGAADETPEHLLPFVAALAGGADVAGAGPVAAAGSGVAAAAAAHAAARRAALDGLKAMYEPLGESALALVAEALPIASEAMEDADAHVRTSALRLMRTLEQASMEDME